MVNFLKCRGDVNNQLLHGHSAWTNTIVYLIESTEPSLNVRYNIIFDLAIGMLDNHSFQKETEAQHGKYKQLKFDSESYRSN